MLEIVFLLLVSHVYSEMIGNDNLFNTQKYKSDFTSNNVRGARVLFNLTMQGSATAIPTDLGDGTVAIADFGTFISRFNVTGTGDVLWQENITTLIGAPLGYYARAGMVYKDGLLIGGTASYKNLLTPGKPGYGAWLFALNASTGSFVWKTQVSTHIYAIITQDLFLDDEYVVVGISSGEAAAPLVPGYVCCSFVGSTVKVKASTGEVMFNRPNIPDELAGIGLFSGGASWGGKTVRVGNYYYQVSGQLYQSEQASVNCSIANPNNASCVDRRVLFDAVIKLDRDTGEIVSSFRASAADTWNIACFFGGRIPGCQGGPAFDYDITNVVYSVRTRQLIATSKSGWVWYLDLDLNPIVYVSLADGSASGGIVFHTALDDSASLSNLRLFSPVSNGARRVITLPDNTTTTSGVWSAHDGNGQVKWVTVPPYIDSVYGSLSLTNDVVFGSTRFRGDLFALHAETGEILLQLSTKGSMQAAPLVLKDRLVWPTGPGNLLSAGLVNQNQLLVIGL